MAIHCRGFNCHENFPQKVRQAPNTVVYLLSRCWRWTRQTYSADASIPLPASLASVLLRPRQQETGMRCAKQRSSALRVRVPQAWP